jgi:PAS domain S-box-containing protein
MTNLEDRRQSRLHYVYATGVVLLSVAVQAAIDVPEHLPAFQMSLFAIALTAFLFSNSVALWSVFLSAIAQKLLFIQPYWKPWIYSVNEALQYALFVLVSLTLCYVIDRLKRARSANDVTLRELIRSNRARQLSDLRLEAGLDSIEDPILLLQPDRNASGVIDDFIVEYLNAPAAALNLGGAAARESQTGRRLSDAAPIHLQHNLFADYIRVLENGTRLDREVTMESPADGKVHEIQVRAHRMGDSVVVHWRDISDYRRAQSTSVLSEGRYKSLVEAIGAIVWNSPANGEFETPQLEWSVFTGQKFEELRGWGWLDAVHPDDRARTAQQWAAAMANHRSLDIDHRLRRSDGQYRSMHVRAVPILDSNGHVHEWLGVHTDVTERKRAEEIIADNERQLRRVLNALYTFVSVLTPDGVLLGANDAPLRAASIRAEDVVGKRYPDTHWWNFSEDSRNQVAGWIEKARAGQIIREDVQIRMAGGAMIPIDFMLYPMRDENGVVTNLIASGVDISDRKRAEAQLADSERHYRQLIEGMPMMSWSCTPDGAFDFLNAGWVEYTGRPMAELLEHGWMDAVHPEDRPALRQVWNESVRTSKPLITEFRIRSKEGDYRWHDTRAVPLHDAKGNVIKWFGTNMDTDGRRRAEQRFRRLYESNLVGIVYYDAQLELSDPNEAFLAILGYGPDERPPRLNIRELTPPEWHDVDEQQVKLIQSQGKSGPFEKQFFRKDGSRVNVMIAAADIDPGKHDHGVAFVVDLTPVKQVEEALRQTEASLRSVNESLENRIRERTAELQLRSDQLRALALDLTETESRERKRLAQILHDHFQQLVSAAKLKVGIIRRKVSEPALLETLSQAESLLAETIDASRNLATELSPPVLHDGGLQQALEWLARKMERDHELHVDLHIDSDCEPDNEQVRVILFECARELLFNVVKHAGTPNAELSVSMSREGLLQLVVRDQGKGFDPNVLESLAQPDGSFGLLNIKERLALLGGLVRIQSSSEGGTTTMISVPIAIATKAAPRQVVDDAARNLTRRSSDVPTVRVLVADDHRLFREGLISLISQESFVNIVGQANDGQEAIEMARELKPDILLCDITMPKLNGIQVAAQLSSEMPELRIIGLSMHEREDMANAMTEAGAVAYCTKGGPTDNLLAVLREVASSGSAKSD